MKAFVFSNVTLIYFYSHKEYDIYMYVLCSKFIEELVGCIFTMTLDTHISCKANRTQIVQRLKCQLLDSFFLLSET